MKLHLKIDENYRFDRNHYPERYPYQVLLPGLVTSKSWCAEVLHAVRDVAEKLTGGVYGLVATRDADTGVRTGYRFGANDAEIVHQVLVAFERAVQRAERVKS